MSLIQLQSQYNGHGMVTVVLEDGASVARFREEAEARQWAAIEYDITPESLEYDR